MNDLEMAKAFAKLEGVELHKDTTIYKSMFCDARRLARPSMTNKEIEKRMYGCENSNYNPLLPNALNCAARDKYLVSINHDFKLVCIKNNIKCGVIYQSVDDIPKAVIECILKSEGDLEMINIHWMTKRSLSLLLNSGELYRGKSGKIKIKTHSELQGQVARESVWTEQSVIINELKEKG